LIIQFIYQLLSAVSYIHSLNIVHGMINLGSLLITYEKYKLVGKQGYAYMVQPELMSFDTAIQMQSAESSF
jgi:serine/threonine protein kinase